MARRPASGPGGQGCDGRQIQVIVVIVRQQQDVDRRQPNGREALGTERRQRRGMFGQEWIGQDGAAVTARGRAARVRLNARRLSSIGIGHSARGAPDIRSTNRDLPPTWKIDRRGPGLEFVTIMV
jgi:hypothetical protein